MFEQFIFHFSLLVFLLLFLRFYSMNRLCSISVVFIILCTCQVHIRFIATTLQSLYSWLHQTIVIRRVEEHEFRESCRLMTNERRE
jgi:hypothetical protein